MTFQGKLQKILHIGDAGAILHCGISEDEQTVASCSTNTKVLLWQVETGSCIASLDGHKTDVTRCSFGKELLATGSRDGTVMLWKYTDCKRTSIITTHSAQIKSCAISPNSQFLCTTSEDKKCRVWTIRGGNGEFIRGSKYKELVHEGDKFIFTDASFSPDNCAIVTSSSDGQVRLWDTVTGECLMTLCDDEERVTHARFSADGKFVVTLSKYNLKVWNIAKNNLLWSTDNEKGLQALCCNPKENMFIVVSRDSTMTGYHISNSTEIFKMETPHQGPILSCNFSASGNMVVTGGVDGKVLVWI